MIGHVAFDLCLQLGHLFATGHQVGDLFAGLFALLEIRRDGAADQHGKMALTRAVIARMPVSLLVTRLVISTGSPC